MPAIAARRMAVRGESAASIEMINLSGQRFGNLTVRTLSHRKSQRAYWHCDCDCGKTTVAATADLRNVRRHRSCGCIKRKSPWGIGARFGRAIVVRRDTKRCEDNGGFLTLQCDCGTIFRLTAQRAREIAQEMSLACRPCRDKEKGETSLRRILRSKKCRVCGAPDHSQRDCPNKPRGKYEKYCARCEGMSWRRTKPKCRRCGEPYQAEPPISAAYIHAVSVGSGPIFPEPVWLPDPRAEQQ